MSASRPHPAAFAGHDARLIGERAATRCHQRCSGDTGRAHRDWQQLKGVDEPIAQRAQLMAPLTALDGVMPTFD
jgi:hypothetical protein